MVQQNKRYCNYYRVPTKHFLFRVQHIKLFYYIMRSITAAPNALIVEGHMLVEYPKHYFFSFSP